MPSNSRKRTISASWASALRRPDIGRSGLDLGAVGVAPSAAEVATVSTMTGIKRYRRPSTGAAMAKALAPARCRPARRGIATDYGAKTVRKDYVAAVSPTRDRSTVDTHP